MQSQAGHPAKPESQVTIRMMNLFTIEANGIVHEELMAKSRKGISLVQYLILERGRPISSQRLIRELWSDRRTENPESALKTMVSRMRAALNSISPGLGSCIVSGMEGPGPGPTAAATESGYLSLYCLGSSAFGTYTPTPPRHGE